MLFPLHYLSFKVAPAPHQLVYVHLGAGYPKEIRSPHWCYVVQVDGQKLLVIPLSSIKENPGPASVLYEFDIVEQDGTIGRMHFDDMRSIDNMRIIQKKNYRKVLTSREDFMNALDKYPKA